MHCRSRKSPASLNRRLLIQAVQLVRECFCSTRSAKRRAQHTYTRIPARSCLGLPLAAARASCACDVARHTFHPNSTHRRRAEAITMRRQSVHPLSRLSMNSEEPRLSLGGVAKGKPGRHSLAGPPAVAPRLSRGATTKRRSSGAGGDGAATGGAGTRRSSTYGSKTSKAGRLVDPRPVADRA